MEKDFEKRKPQQLDQEYSEIWLRRKEKMTSTLHKKYSTQRVMYFNIKRFRFQSNGTYIFIL